MNGPQLLGEAQKLLEESKTAILANIDKGGSPRMRWMSPYIPSASSNIVYAVTSPALSKTEELKDNPNVQWMFQTKLLNRIITLTGTINIIENPALKAEILESVKKRLHIFWNLSGENTDFVILETVLEKGELFEPAQSKKVTVNFS